MESNNITRLISMYFDGELKKTEEALLFTQLAESAEGREYFRQLSRIRSAVEESFEEFPGELEERILRSAGRQVMKKKLFGDGRKISAFISYAAVLIMLFLSAYVLTQVSYYREKVDDLSVRMERQNETIKMLYNSLPDIEVKAASGNEIVIKPSL